MSKNPAHFRTRRGRLPLATSGLCLAITLPLTGIRAQEISPTPVTPLAPDESQVVEDPNAPENTETPKPEGEEGQLPPVVTPLPTESALPPLVEPLPVPTLDGSTPILPLDGSVPVTPPDSDLNPLDIPLEEPTETQTTDDLLFQNAATFQGTGYGGLPTAPSGFLGNSFGGPMGYGGLGLGPGLAGNRLRKGFHATASLTGSYSTNVNPNGGDDSGSSQNEGDFVVGLGGTLSYMSTAPRFTFGGSYNGNYSQYFSQSDLSGYSQSGSLLANYDGGKWTAALSVGLSYDRGSNRYYDSEYVGRFNITTGLNVSYEVSSKTSIQGNIGTGFSATSDGNFDDTGTFDAGLSGLYRYSSKTQFGPGIHYGYQSASGDDSNARTSVGPTFTVNYRVSSLWNLNTTVGMDFSSYEDGQSTDISFTGSLSLAYNPSKFWGMSLSMYTGVQPDPSNTGGFINTTSLGINYHRQIRRASLNLGLNYNLDDSEDGGGAVNTSDNFGNSWSLNGSIGMPVFANFCEASLFASYSDQGGGNFYSSTSIGISFSKTF